MDVFISAFSWRPLFGGVMIGTERVPMTSRVDESSVPKYGGFSPLAEKD
jgi:hypothetical protein